MSGVRARKKQATREALTTAALRLVLERGLENVRVEDIAAEAGVSLRTFANYFPGKDDAVIAGHTDRLGRAAAALRARPPEEPLWEALPRAMVEPWERYSGTPPHPELLASVRILADSPELQAASMRAVFATDGELAAAIADRVYADAARADAARPDSSRTDGARADLYPRLVAVTATAVVQTAVVHWLHADPPVPLVPLLRESLRALGAGLPGTGTGTGTGAGTGAGAA